MENQAPIKKTLSVSKRKVNCAKANKILAENYPSTSKNGSLYTGFKASELVIGIVNAVGTEYQYPVNYLVDHLKNYGYTSIEIKVSRDIIQELSGSKVENKTEYERINTFMNLGNELRKEFDDNSILALGVAKYILQQREIEKEEPKPKNKTVYIIESLKHPAEVNCLRDIYSNGFFLVGVYSDKEYRSSYLQTKQMSASEANKLIDRDEHESFKYGQDTRTTFQMSDFFWEWAGDAQKIRADVCRSIDIIFGHPYISPTFDEYAMFMAFASSLRSADLSRQVGAVIANNNEIIASGANDCPKFGGGLYWCKYDEKKKEYADIENGRDFKRGWDSNKKELNKIAHNIIECLGLEEKQIKALLENSLLKDITEYGRIVHAEMESILMCARNNQSCIGTTLYCTTFPCHNCAKHIIAAGIKKVYYIEPYPKSKAIMFHSEAISDKLDCNKVSFLPFIGVGPKRFFDFFSITMSTGYDIIRKTSNGEIIDWKRQNAYSRFQLIPASYIEKEMMALSFLEAKTKGKEV